MFKFLNLQPEIFGIEINDLSLRIVKLRKKRKGFNLVSSNEANIPPGIVKEGVIQDQETLTKIIKFACNTVKGEKIGTRYVAASLPEEKSFSQVIQMPKMSQEELKLAVPFEAENYIPLPIDKVYLDFQVINFHNKDNINHLDLLINVMPKHIIDSYISCFKKAGLIPYILEVESQSIVRALINSKRQEESAGQQRNQNSNIKNGQENLSLLIIDFGVANTSFIIFSGNSVRFTSSISISSQELTNAISNTLGVSLEKAEELKIKYGLKEDGKKYNIFKAIKPILTDLVSQIRKYIIFYSDHASHEYLLSNGKSDQKIEKIIICGGGANLKGLSDFLRDELKIPVEIGNPLTNIPSYDKIGNQIIHRREIISFTTVLGLALRGANEEI